jgi:GNAT superfamily N-acetyltransferase
MPELEITQSDPASPAADLEGLAEVLHASVHAGASVSFVLPFSLDDARAFWRDAVLPRVESGARRLLIARWNGRLAGTVQLLLDTPPRHRAEIAKLLVHPGVRRAGIARALMYAVEALARDAGRTLLTLDTRTGDHAEPLYLSLGYVVAGVIPNYARSPLSPALEATTIMYKVLQRAP